MPTSMISPTPTSTTTMVATHFTNDQAIGSEEDLEKLNQDQECNELLISLPRERGWRTPYIYKYQGFWCQPKEIQSIISFQKHFQPRENDVILASIPKSGTTWLKALSFAIVNRDRFAFSSNNHPLLLSNPHDLVPFFEYKLYANNNQAPDLSKLSLRPRLFATHIPFASLMHNSSIINNSKVVYICRNPFDTFLSTWIYVNKIRSATLPPLSLEECFKMFCKGIVGFGPFWDHMLGYWKESLDRPEMVLFLKYEDLKEDVSFHLKKIAEFVGFPFSTEEEKEGVVEGIAKLCSFEKLKGLEVNKSGKSIKNFQNKHLFRKGEVGDWVNYLSRSMVEELSQVMEEKLGGSGLEFKLFSQLGKGSATSR